MKFSKLTVKDYYDCTRYRVLLMDMESGSKPGVVDLTVPTSEAGTTGIVDIDEGELQLALFESGDEENALGYSGYEALTIWKPFIQRMAAKGFITKDDEVAGMKAVEEGREWMRRTEEAEAGQGDAEVTRFIDTALINPYDYAEDGYVLARAYGDALVSTDGNRIHWAYGIGAVYNGDIDAENDSAGDPRELVPLKEDVNRTVTRATFNAELLRDALREMNGNTVTIEIAKETPKDDGKADDTIYISGYINGNKACAMIGNMRSNRTWSGYETLRSWRDQIGKKLIDWGAVQDAGRRMK